MDSIPENFIQCAFSFDDLNAQPLEQISYEVVELQGTRQKQCKDCELFFPATKDFFTPGKKMRDGLRNTCKKCRQKKRRKTEPLPEGYRRCGKCEKVLQATHEFFPYHRREGRDTLDCYCYQCRHDIYLEKTSEDKCIGPSEMQCKDCEQTMPFTEAYFHKDPTMYYGLKQTCKVCVYAKQVQDRKANPKKYSRSVREWRNKNKERALQRERKWREANRERRREQERNRRKANPEPFKANSKRYRQTEHGRMKSLAHSHLRRARKKSIPGTYTPTQIQEQLKRQRYKCYYCHHKLEKRGNRHIYHIDHTFPISREYSSNEISHLVMACPACNQKKSDKYPWEFPEGGRLC